MADQDEQATILEEPARSEGFLDVFVIRSFRESHLQDVVKKIEEFISTYESPYWGSKAYRVTDTEQDISSGHFLREEVTQKILNAAITVVIIDGLRHNVLFELGFLYSSRKPFLLLKHKRWGPSFSELDLLASDVKGVVVKEFDHEHKEGDSFKKLLSHEFKQCEKKFLSALGTHSLLSRSGENLVEQEWAFKGTEGKDPREDRKTLDLTSFQSVDLNINCHISTSSLFIVEFHLVKPDAALIAYLRVHLRKGEQDVRVWFGYASSIAAPIIYPTPTTSPAEITVPFFASGPCAYILVDNIYQMVVQRLGTSEPGHLMVEKIRLRGSRNDSLTRVSKVMISEC